MLFLDFLIEAFRLMGSSLSYSCVCMKPRFKADWLKIVVEISCFDYIGSSGNCNFSLLTVKTLGKLLEVFGLT